jgi:alpha-glucan,water dikinase
VLSRVLTAGAAGAAFLFTWLRLSSNQVLCWQRAFSYQPKDIAWAQQQVADRVAALAREAADPDVRAWARRSLARLSRGGGNGDEIRMGILNIMRDHGIREGHRPVRGWG